jgi:pimeloyl-ACP methyl ester carboxylesterase
MALFLCMGSGPALTQARSARPPSLAALDAYVGVYRLPDGGQVGVDRFINDAGVAVLLFADYRTNVVRSLRAGSPGDFTMGPSFAEPSPVEMTLRFGEPAGSRAGSVTLLSPDGSRRVAVRAESKDEEVSFTQGDATLAGTLILPDGPGPHPAIVLLHGSGPLTRHSFGPYPRFFNSLGFAVLRYDKRGTGASTGLRIDASTGAPDTLWPNRYPDDLLADALAARRFLRERTDIDSGRIGFWGSSEGGMLATQIGARVKDVAFAINSSGFMGPLWRTILYQVGARLRAGGTPESDVTQATEFNRFWMDVARNGKGYDEYVRRRDALLRCGKGAWLEYYSGSYSSLEQMRWSWDHILAFDSLTALADVDCPVLGVFGEHDVSTDSAEAARALRDALIAGGNRDVTTRIVPNASHSLMNASRTSMAIGVFETLAEWLHTRVGTRPLAKSHAIAADRR